MAFFIFWAIFFLWIGDFTEPRLRIFAKTSGYFETFSGTYAKGENLKPEHW